MITAVTGYVPIPSHPRSEEEYHELGLRLREAGIPLMVMENTLEQCWLQRFLANFNREVTHSVSDNPIKNSVAYHIVQAQKSTWLVQAARDNQAAQVLVWIDYGIFHLDGITSELLQAFMERAKEEQSIAIPGCWGADYIYDDNNPCWRFCGGVIVVPRRLVLAFDLAMKREYATWLQAGGNLSWEVNTMARLEQRSALPIRHYKADHNAQMFAAYQNPVTVKDSENV